MKINTNSQAKSQSLNYAANILMSTTGGGGLVALRIKWFEGNLSYSSKLLIFNSGKCKITVNYYTKSVQRKFVGSSWLNLESIELNEKDWTMNKIGKSLTNFFIFLRCNLVRFMVPLQEPHKVVLSQYHWK